MCNVHKTAVQRNVCAREEGLCSICMYICECTFHRTCTHKSPRTCCRTSNEARKAFTGRRPSPPPLQPCQFALKGAAFAQVTDGSDFAQGRQAGRRRGTTIGCHSQDVPVLFIEQGCQVGLCEMKGAERQTEGRGCDEKERESG